jgi:hypothetical protein
MTEEIHKTTVVDLAAIRAAKAARAAWRQRCIEAMGRHTAETVRQIALHAVTIDLDEGVG